MNVSMEDASPAFVIGHNNSKGLPTLPAYSLQIAQNAGYDLVTVPITTPHFQSRILTLISTCLSQQRGRSVRASVDQSLHSQPEIVPTISPLQPIDSNLSPDESLSQVIAVCSSWIDLCSPDPLIAGISRQVLQLEITYAAFCGVSNVLIPGPKWPHRTLREGGLMQYARAIQTALESGPYLQILIWSPLIDLPEQEEIVGDLAQHVREDFLDEDVQGKKLELFGSWEAWNFIRTLCKYHPRLCAALSLPRHLPPVAVQSRWFSESVRLLSFDNNSFTKNAKGYPVLSKAHQALISRYARLKTPPWYLLCNVDLAMESDSSQSSGQGTLQMNDDLSQAAAFHTPAEAAEQYPSANPKPLDRTPHLSYLRNLQRKQPPQSAMERFGAGYQDFLQAPLQPLTVNLESITYEVFEKDPIKYEWYERAIEKALRDWVEQGKPASREDGRIVVAVVGAGRGPLVTRALRAADNAGVSIDMWALEKNPNAFVLLSRHNETIWNHRVKLVQSDMRTWQGPWVQEDNGSMGAPVPESSIGQAISSLADIAEMAVNATSLDLPDPQETHKVPAIKYYGIDILISELLGSFGDNELSPECLDGVTHLLNPVHGISIPCSYSAQLSPIAAPKLHADVMAQSTANPSAPETPYVVMLHAIDHLSTFPYSPVAGDQHSGSRSDSPDVKQIGFAGAVPDIQTAWMFSHPNHSIRQGTTTGPPTSNAHNTRESATSFRIRDRGVCHGLAGYFETVLYPGIELSTNPVTMDQKSAGMISWFPIYFPLKQPLFVPDNSIMVVHMWRLTDERKVWYEWMVEVFIWDRGYNRGSTADTDPAKGRGTGRKIRVGVSELHSSIKEACLM